MRGFDETGPTEAERERREREGTEMQRRMEERAAYAMPRVPFGAAVKFYPNYVGDPRTTVPAFATNLGDKALGLMYLSLTSGRFLPADGVPHATDPWLRHQGEELLNDDPLALAAWDHSDTDKQLLELRERIAALEEAQARKGRPRGD